MVLIAISIIVVLGGLPLILLILARRGRVLRIASAFIATGAGIGVGAVAFAPASSLPDVPILGAAIELIMMVALPFTLLLLLLYPLGMIGFGLFSVLSAPGHSIT